MYTLFFLVFPYIFFTCILLYAISNKYICTIVESTEETRVMVLCPIFLNFDSALSTSTEVLQCET